jgi:parallel beta-helix repeat protein
MAGERLEPRALLTVSVPPSITTDTVEIDDNVVVSSPGGSITATGGPGTSGHVQIFGNSKGRIDGAPNPSVQASEDLTITADGFITVTGGIGGIQRLDDLTLTSVAAQPISLQQGVSLTGDLTVIKAGGFTVGSTVTVDRDLVIDQADMVTFSGNVTVGRNLTITNATGVTFAGTLTVGGSLTIVNSTGTTRFVGDVLVGSAAITSTTLVQVMADFTTTGAAGDGDVTFTTNQVNFTTASLGVDSAATGATLVIKPQTLSRPLTIASPPGVPAGVNITDADILAIQPGWKRVVFGDEAGGTGAVRIGSIGSQYGGFSQILNTTTIVGGSVQVVQPVDVTPLAIYLELIALGTGTPGSGSVTIDAPINQTEGERNVWVRLESAGSIAINAPVWADQIVSLTTTAGGTITQTATGSAVTTPSLAVDADGAVTLADSGNAFALVAIKTTNDSVVLREDSGYSISQITTIDDGRDSRPTAEVTGINTGTATVRLVTISGGAASPVGQGRSILAGGLGLEGAGTDWNLSLATNDIATLAANTGSVVFRDVDDLTIGTVAAISPRGEIAGITVARTLDVEAGTTLTITAAGDIISAASSGTAVNLEAPSGISTAGDMITAGGNVEFDHATTLTGDVVLDLEDGPNRGLVTFFDAVDGTTAGQESLTIGGDLDAELSIGAAVALQSLSVSGDSALAGGITLRTTGNQTYSGEAWSIGTITIQAGSGSTVAFLGEVSLGGLVTATGDTAAYNVSLTGSPVSITNAVTFATSGTVTLGDASTDSLTFAGGVTSTAPVLTNLAGTIATTDANASFGTTALTADTTVSTGTGAVNFTGTVDGGQALVVNAGGATTFGGVVGGATPLASLVTDAAGTTRLNGSTIKTSGAAGIVFNDPVTLGVITDLTAASDGVITFASTLDGASSLTARTGGITTFGGAVGSITPLTLVATDAGGETRINGGSVRTSDPVGQLYGDAVVLGAATTLTATNSGLVVFASTLDGEHSLAVNTAGLTSFGGAVGGAAALASLVTDAAGTTKIAGGSATTSGDAGQVYNDAVELQAATTLTAHASGPITFAQTLDGTVTLNADTEGETTFGGAVGSTIPLGAITTDAGGTTRINGGSVRTVFAAGQTYGDAVLLGANTTLTADNAGMIRFASTLDRGFTLAVNTQGETGFDGAVGGSTPLVSLATDAGGTTAISGGSIKTSGPAGQVFGDAVLLIADTTLAADGGGAVTFVSTVDGFQRLVVNTGGDTTFSAAVGGTDPLAHVETDAPGRTLVNGGLVRTASPVSQFYADPVRLGATTLFEALSGGAITFGGTLDGGFAATVNTSGTTTFTGAVGGTAPLVSLATDAGGMTEINGGAVTTSGGAGQVYNDAVTLGANAILAAGASGPIRFATTLDGAFTLAANTQGATTFDGAVGGTANLVSLATDTGGTTAINGRLIATSGAAGQVFNDAVLLGADATLTENNAGPITFVTSLDGPYALAANTQGTTTFGGAVGSSAPLAAVVTDYGGTTEINGGSVTTAAPLVLAASPGDDVGMLVESGQFYDDAVVLGADAVLTAGGIGLIPTAVLDGDEIRFATTVDGAHSLTVNTAGTATFSGPVGSVTPLVSLATDADGTTSVTGRLVRTTGNQTYADPLIFEPVVYDNAFDLEVSLPAEGEDADLDSSFSEFPTTLLAGATVSALQGIRGGGHNLVIEGDAVFGDQPGSVIPDDVVNAVDPVADLNDLRITGTTTVNSTLIVSTGHQTYESGVVLGSDVFFAGSGQRFESTVTGIGRVLRVAATSAGIVFDGDVGTAAEPLGGVSAIAFGGDVQINAAIYSVNPVFITSVFGSVIGGANNAIHAPGTTAKLLGLAGIGVGTPIAVEAASVSAISTGGDVRLRGLGDLIVGEESWLANGTLDLDASGEIRVPGGRTIQAGQGVTTTKPIRWGLLGTADSGRGSLRDVIGQANATGAPGIVEFGNTPATYVLAAQLPDIATSLVLDGGGRVTIAGNNRVLNGVTFVSGSAGSRLAGVSLQGFRNYGVRLVNSPGVTVEDIRVTSLNTAQSMGLYATGDLAGTTIVGSRFSGGLRGALLVNARNLAFGAIGRGNTFVGNRSVPGSRFAGTGIRAQGDSSGTVVEGNTFTQNHYGFAFINARNLRLANNLFTRNTIAAIFVEGNNTGSAAVGNTFGTGGQRNAKTFQRVRGATGV